MIPGNVLRAGNLIFDTVKLLGNLGNECDKDYFCDKRVC